MPFVAPVPGRLALANPSLADHPLRVGQTAPARSWGDGGQRAADPSDRASAADPASARRVFRICAVLVLVVVLSLGDLYMTLLHATGAGMFEGNPLARVIMQTGSTGLLVAFKLATVALAVGILWRQRRSRCAEFAAWACALGLTWLTLHWTAYSDGISTYTSEIAAMSIAPDSAFTTRFVSMAPAP